jgi:hypothetical protein
MEPLNVIYGLKLRDETYPIRYVGLTSRGASVRFKEHCTLALRGETPLYRWIRKHGYDNVECVIIDEVSDPEALDEREIYWINQLSTFAGDGHGGFNLTRGGTGFTGYDIGYQLASAERLAEADSILQELDQLVDSWRQQTVEPAELDRLTERIAAWYSDPGGGTHMSLEHYYSVENAKKCTTCRLPPPVLAQIEAGRAAEAPIPFTVISRWLEVEGYSISPLSLPNHWRAFHHIRVTS